MTDVLRTLVGPHFEYGLATLVLLCGAVAGYLVGWIHRRVMLAAGVDEIVEGTTVERLARRSGTTTVDLTARFVSTVVYIVAVLVALDAAQFSIQKPLWRLLGSILPSVLAAVVVVVVGVLVGDKVEVFVTERLRSVKFPEASVVAVAARYTVVLATGLVALSQLGVAVAALLVVFGVYLASVVVFALVATRQLLASAAAGVYLLLRQPYGIGDQVAIGSREGVVQEVDVFVTRIEADSREYVIPNHLVFRDGIVIVHHQ
ncbi:mechanosensitive ion channel [Halobacterium salinarum]|uniref:mechanosensitive ion channel domain-containing protein n=1 Tax=Halobacterium TaxID=2239 RepID=UPI00196499BA|nr:MULTISPECIES: mechanosensitive ion channel domain-containing protein [Halobacterium]MCF2165221.1 mechanosensitive ion channel family protein [Halobacterium salinarum]MCF2167970.1 mechanosensitive ion channel family protein [Halobacterium salinarum]MCF2238708.1 mechanosensitive ion channel family protein [Halobacterium salinarum]MDL0129063.1 mechanosensitive ion channel [Halobacterium salinarum]MDL0140447.1 mechanosensitive ion channel [Halobacterium salinarum]